jgi:low affinity Fe/Cu permease
MESIIAAILSGVVTLIGVLIANSRSNAVMEYKIEELTREVRKHNGFAEKIPVIQRDIQVLNHRMSDIEVHECERERSNV